MKRQSTEYYFTWLIIFVTALAIGFLGSQIVGGLYYNKLVKNNPALDSFESNYTNQINSLENPYDLAKMGTIFLKTGFDNLALASFQKAAALSPNWRDAWVGLGASSLKNNQPKEALAALKKAEALDPIYPLTYQFLANAYKLSGDNTSSEKAQEKYSYLEKTYPNK